MNKKSICLLVSICLLISNVFASTNTYERTRDNLQVADDINVTDSNINSILKTPKVDETEKVYDFADLLTTSEENELYNEITSFINKTNLDMVVVTINDNPKSSSMNYADDFYDYNYFGIEDTNDGLLFLMDMDKREMWLSTTGEAQIMYDDERIGSILDAAYSKITIEEYYECASVVIDRTENYYDLGIPSSNQNAYIDENGNYVYDDTIERITDSILTGLMFAVPLTLLNIVIMALQHRTVKKAVVATEYMKNAKITISEDLFLTTHTDRVYDPPSSSSSLGGSSTHRSSSGRSHGGGGRRF